MVVLAIILGFVVGVGGFVPLIFGMNLARRSTPTSNFGHAGALILGVFVSLILLAVAAALCIILAREFALPFVLSQSVGLITAAIVFGIKKQLGNK